MGKTDKSQRCIDELDELFHDELNDTMDVDEYLERLALGSPTRVRARRRQNNSPDFKDDAERHHLPEDWRDFDYTSDRHSQEDWD